MPGESNPAVEPANADQAKASVVTDEDLDRAAAEAMSRLEGKAPEKQPEPATEVPATEQPTQAEPQEPSGEEPPKEEPTEEPPAEPADKPPPADDEDHKERTRLGRKVAKLEDSLTAVLKQNQELIDILKTRQAPPAQPAEPAEPEVITTAEDVIKVMDRHRQEQEARQRESLVNYQRGYLGELNAWMEKATEDGDADAKEIRALLTKEGPDAHFNVKHSSDPRADFERNLNRATAHYWKQKAAAPKKEERPIPVKNEKPKAPLGVAGESKSDGVKPPPPIQLSPAAKAYAEKMGMTEDEVRAAMSRPVSASFARGR